MRMPGSERAHVEAEKLTGYLLSREHPVGRFKAAFFAKLGYTLQTWEQLLVELQRIADSEDAIMGQESDFGQKYEVRTELAGPSGWTSAVVTVWLVRRGENFPRFVTAYPGEQP